MSKMGAYVGWTVAAILVLAGFVLLLLVPGVGVLAVLALAIGIVLAALLGISYGAAHQGELTSDVEERRAEHVDRQRPRRRAR
jgi:hypothetical protein